MKLNNIHTIRVPEGEEEEQGKENLFEKVMMENFPNMTREKLTQVQKPQRVPIKNLKRPTPRKIIIKMATFKGKEVILKAAREKQEIIYKGALIRLAADFSTDTLKSQKGIPRNVACNEKQKSATETTLSSKALN